MADSSKATRTVDFNRRLCEFLLDHVCIKIFNLSMAELDINILITLCRLETFIMTAAGEILQKAEKNFQARREEDSLVCVSIAIEDASLRELGIWLLLPVLRLALALHRYLEADERVCGMFHVIVISQTSFNFFINADA